jgi:spore coat protein U-like protein
MKKILMAVVAVAVVAMAGSAMALDTTTVNVSATVTGTCRFLTGGSVAFGALDPASGSDMPGTVTQPTFWCTSGSSFTISDDLGANDTGGVRRMAGGTPAGFIPYTFAYTSTGTGTGRTNPITMNITASVAYADYRNASEGSYSDSVILTINP